MPRPVRLASDVLVAFVFLVLLLGVGGVDARAQQRAASPEIHLNRYYRFPGDTNLARLVAGLARRSGGPSIAYDVWMYHDQQRLADDTGDGYGPPARAFALGDDGIDDLARFNSPNTVLVAVVHVDPDAMTLPASYTRLNLHYGDNCVWLGHSGDAVGRNWEAWIAPSISTTDCPASPSGAAGAMKLPVATFWRNGADSADIPAVARWDETKTRSQPLLGLRCSRAWCVIGTAARSDVADPSHQTTLTPSPLPTLSPQWNVRGWFDEQRVAVGPRTALRPRMRASAVPNPGLATISLADFDTIWQYVALVHVKGPPDPKYAAWGFRAGWNRLWLRRDRSVEDPNDGWSAAVTRNHVARPTSANARLYVHRTPHPGHAVPATARWAWFEDDEGVWSRCDVGCCQVDTTPAVALHDSDVARPATRTIVRRVALRPKQSLVGPGPTDADARPTR